MKHISIKMRDPFIYSFPYAFLRNYVRIQSVKGRVFKKHLPLL